MAGFAVEDSTVTSLRVLVSIGSILFFYGGVVRPVSVGTSQPPGMKVQEDDPAVFQAALQRAVSGKWNALHLEAECLTEAGPRLLEVHGDGVAIWGGSVQFKLSPDQIRRILRLFDEAGFAGFEDRYGGKEDPVKLSSRMAIRVTCRVALTIDGQGKQVVQLEGGRQSKKLHELVRGVFSFCKEPARVGLGADSVEDGLRKLSEGKLAPETFSLMLHYKPTPRSPAADRGWLMRIQGRKVSIQVSIPGQGYQEAVERNFSEAELRDLASYLGHQEVDHLPVNLYAEVYTDFSVQVLNRDKNVQARKFAGMNPVIHGEKQLQFARIFEYLQQLHSRILDSN